MDRDSNDHIRFCPLQSALGQRLLTEHEAPIDCSTAVLIDGEGVHTESAAILRLFPSMGFPWSVIGPIGLCVPRIVRDAAYRAFARNRGPIWRCVKAAAGLGDTTLEKHRDRMLGLEEPIPEDWGFRNGNGDEQASKRDA